VEFDGDGCAKLATTSDLGESGVWLYRVCDGVLRPLVSFEKTEQVIRESDGQYHWGWTPTYIVTIDERTMVMGGEYGGLYLLTKSRGTAWTMRSLDDRLGRPIVF
jgi:hypothetical protein